MTIVDAGLPGYWKDLPVELAAMGRSLDDVRAIVLTHGDTDHIGFAERLRRERGIPVFVHSLDANRARGEVSKPMSGWGPIKIRPLLGFLVYSGRRGGLRVPPVKEVVTFEDGATLDVPGAPRIIHIPGHTPGSSAIHVPSVDAIFLGDAMTTRSVLTGEMGPRRHHSPSSRPRRSARCRNWTVSTRNGCCRVTARRGMAASCRAQPHPGGRVMGDGPALGHDRPPPRWDR